jgi:hypothetical protein
MAQQKQRLKLIMEYLKENGKAVRFGDLMRQGFYSFVIKMVAEEVGAKLDYDDQGYSIIAF